MSSPPLSLPLSPNWKPVSLERVGQPLPTSVIFPKVTHIGDALLGSCKSLLNQSSESTFRKALKHPEQYQDLLKDFRRPFMHALAVHEFCSEDREVPESLRTFVHECGQITDRLRQQHRVNKRTTDQLLEMLEAMRNEQDKILQFEPVGNGKFLSRILRRRADIAFKCGDGTQIFTPKQFHTLRYEIRQLMFLHRGAWKANRKESEPHFHLFLHLLQLNERMGYLNDSLIDTAEENPLFLTPLDHNDISRYLQVEIQS